MTDEAVSEEATYDDSDLEEVPQSEGGAALTESGVEADEGSIGELDLPPAIEAVLMVVDEPVATVTLAQVLQRPEADVAAACEQLAGEYVDQSRGFVLREIAGGWRYYSSPLYDEVVQRFVLDGQRARLTQAALETLAVVAYRQPVSRSRISAVRGVNVDGVIRTLLTRGLVEECGTDGKSGAHLYQTTGYFLERLGAASLADLPELAPYLPDLETLEAEL
ncbi:MAG: SMC-Scp complex subunit ScpB [Actinomycetia bacterium]|nr:SMC-Scp complex subunit ScpB [Actinomycetes bacterium]